jgi:hypothetical protein
MGPQHLSCGNPVPVRNLSDDSSSFNGAAASQLRKYPRFIGLRADQMDASMGPQHLSCGNPARPLVLDRLESASMGPQHLSCGNATYLEATAQDKAASMGPQHLSCGNQCVTQIFIRTVSCFNGAAASQLRKSAPNDRRPRRTIRLQWGRSISAAEMALAEAPVLLHFLTHNASASPLHNVHSMSNNVSHLLL